MIQRNDLFSYAPPAPAVRSVTDAAIDAAAEHAEAEREGWAIDALEQFRLYAAGHASFLAEEVRSAAYLAGLDVPPAPGAWGSVARRARRCGWITAIGVAPSRNPSQHGKLVTVWESRIFSPAGPQ